MPRSLGVRRDYKYIHESHVAGWKGANAYRTYIPQLVGSVACLGYDGAVPDEDATDGYFA